MLTITGIYHGDDAEDYECGSEGHWLGREGAAVGGLSLLTRS